MDLFEYQAKELYRKHGVPTSRGEVTLTPQEAKRISEEYGTPVMVKAQVKVGGRGKLGGVKYCVTPDEAYLQASNILGLDIKGHIVKKLLVAEAKEIKQEYYISFMLDRASRTFLAICSVDGGMEIEQVAAATPERVAKIPINALDGVDEDLARKIAEQGGLPEEIIDKAAVTISKLWDLFVKEDALLVEVNPLVRTDDDEILALDGKITVDGNAEFRHPEFDALIDLEAADPIEAKARKLNLNYVKLDGEVGIIGNGAGLVMSTLDVVAYAGKKYGGIKPANFLDIGGGASAQVMSNSLEIILEDSQVKSVFVNVFGGITACDEVAKGIIEALKILGTSVQKPIVLRLDGYRVEEGRAVIDQANNPLITVVATMDDAAQKAVELASK